DTPSIVKPSMIGLPASMTAVSPMPGTALVVQLAGSSHWPVVPDDQICVAIAATPQLRYPRKVLGSAAALQSALSHVTKAKPSLPERPQARKPVPTTYI